MLKYLQCILLILSFNFSYGQTNTVQLSPEEKIYGISKLWSEVNYNFANFDVHPLDWDSVYKAYIPKVLSTKTTEEYYSQLTTMVSLLKDGHTNVYYKPMFANYGRPPIQTKLIENIVIVTAVNNDTLKAQNIEVGDELIEINNMSVKEYATKYILPFQSASTPQDLDIRTYSFFLLAGKLDEQLNVKFKKKNGTILRTTLDRRVVNKSALPTYQLNITKDNIAILQINNFEDTNFKEKFDSLYPKILMSKSLIIDIRNNGGGNSEQGDYIISHFIEKTSYTAKSKTRQYIPTFKAWQMPEIWLELAPGIIKPIEGKQIYHKPIVVLTGAKTFSSGEDFLIDFDVAKRGIKIGQATGGSTGQPLFFDLPQGGLARVCTRRCYYPDGKEFIGIGIKPDIEVLETIQAIRDNRDIVLEKAIGYLSAK